MKHSKHIAIVAAGLLAATSALAAGNKDGGFYVQGDIGLANVHAKQDKFRVKNTLKSLKNSYKDSGFMPRVSVGYDFGNNLRVAGDYTHYKTLKDKAHIDETVDGTNLKGDVSLQTKASSLGVSAIYDFPIEGTPVKPYVGARLGVNKMKHDANVSLTLKDYWNGKESGSGSAKDSSTKVGLGALAGVSYQINRNLSADAGYRYNRLGSRVKAHEVSAGVRYTFR